MDGWIDKGKLRGRGGRKTEEEREVGEGGEGGREGQVCLSKNIRLAMMGRKDPLWLIQGSVLFAE